MDINKKKKLEAIGYHVNPCCGICEYAILSEDGWGTCELFNYFHLKHEETRQLSITQYGLCNYYVEDPNKTSPLEKMNS